MVHSLLFYVRVYDSILADYDSLWFKSIDSTTHQVRSITAKGKQMFGWQVRSKESVNLAVLMNYSDALAITDKDASVNAHSQTFGEGQLGFGCGSTITTSDDDISMNSMARFFFLINTCLHFLERIFLRCQPQPQNCWKGLPHYPA